MSTCFYVSFLGSSHFVSAPSVCCSVSCGLAVSVLTKLHPVSFSAFCIGFLTSFALLPPHRKQSPSLPNANSSNRGDQGSLAETCCPWNQSSSNQQVLLPLQSPPFMNSHTNAIERNQTVFLRHAWPFFLFLSFAPPLPPPHLFGFSHTQNRSDLTLVKIPWHHWVTVNFCQLLLW